MARSRSCYHVLLLLAASCAMLRPTFACRCFNDTASMVLTGPYQRQLHDHVTIENCASACAEIGLTVAGIDGGNHCWCGGLADLDSATAKQQARPTAECTPKDCPMKSRDGCSCSGDPAERCGAAQRLMAYEFTCRSTR